MDPDRLPVAGSAIPLRAGTTLLGDADPALIADATILVRRRPGSAPGQLPSMTREQAREALSADPGDMAAVERFARDQGLTILESNAAERKVRVSGPAGLMGRAFGTRLSRYDGPRGPFVSYEGELSVPAALGGVVDQVLGLDRSPIAHR
jgi:kumamolisin